MSAGRVAGRPPNHRWPRRPSAADEVSHKYGASCFYHTNTVRHGTQYHTNTVHHGTLMCIPTIGKLGFGSRAGSPPPGCRETRRLQLARPPSIWRTRRDPGLQLPTGGPGPGRAMTGRSRWHSGPASVMALIFSEKYHVGITASLRWLKEHVALGPSCQAGPVGPRRARAGSLSVTVMQDAESQTANRLTVPSSSQ
jgi:hypothetical protein